MFGLIIFSLGVLLASIPVLYAVCNSPKLWVRGFGMFGWVFLLTFACLGGVMLSSGI